MEQQNDIFGLALANPDITPEELIFTGYTAENTGIKSKDDYKKMEVVQNFYKDSEGNFDDKKFELDYANAYANYVQMAALQNVMDFKKQVVYDEDNIFAPLNQRQSLEPVITRVSNPQHIGYSITNFGKQDERVKSEDEIAQTQLVLTNPLEATKEDGTIDEDVAIWEDAPDEGILSGLFWRTFKDTRVLAQYDEDGTHINPITKEEELHFKGLLKLNQYGNPYYENLEGRAIYGKRVLNKFNTLTSEGSLINEYDFFDSDDIGPKSYTGVVMKNLALVGSMFIPTVGPWLAFLSMATQAARLGAMGLKFINGDDSAVLNEIEGWTTSVDRQQLKTEYDATHAWSFNNWFSACADLAAQMQELRAIFNAPLILKNFKWMGANEALDNIFKNIIQKNIAAATKRAELLNILIKATEESVEKARKVLQQARLSNNKYAIANAEKALAEETAKLDIARKNITATFDAAMLGKMAGEREATEFFKTYNKVGEIMAKMYMAGLISGNMYNEARTAGLSNEAASAATITRFIAEMCLLFTPVGNYLFPELHMNRMLYQLLTSTMFGKITEQMKKYSDLTLPEQKQAFTKWLLKYMKSVPEQGRAILNSEKFTKQWAKSSLVMGFEAGVVNDAEALLDDLVKAGTHYIFNALNSDKLMPFENNWDRYGMGMVTGLVGGSISAGFTQFRGMQQMSKLTTEEALQKIIFMSRNGEINDYFKWLDKNSTHLASDNILAIPKKLQDGSYYNIYNSADYRKGDIQTMNLDQYTKTLIKLYILDINTILDANDVNISDDKLLSKQIMGDLRLQYLITSGAANRLLNRYNAAVADLVKASIMYAPNAVTDTNKKEAQEATKTAQTESGSLKTIEAIKTELQDMIKGKYAVTLALDALYEMTPLFRSFLAPQLLTFDRYVEWKANKQVNALTDTEKNNLLREYDDIIHNLDLSHHMSQLFFNKFVKGTAKAIENSKLIYKDSIDSFTKDEAINTLHNLHNWFYSNEWYQAGENSTPSDFLQELQNAINGSVLEGTLINTFANNAGIEIAELKQDSDNTNTESNSNVVKFDDRSLLLTLAKVYSLSIVPILAQDHIHPEVQKIILSLSKILQNRIETAGLSENEVQKNISQPIAEAFNEYAKKSSDELFKTATTYFNIAAEGGKFEFEDAIGAITDGTIFANKTTTDILKVIDSFIPLSSDSDVSISALLEQLNDKYANLSSSIDRFSDTTYLNKIDQALFYLLGLQAALMAARTDTVSALNPYGGFNQILNTLANHYNSQEGINEKIEWEELPTIEPESLGSNPADVMMHDVQMIITKLDYFKNLIKLNQSQLLNKQQEVLAVQLHNYYDKVTSYLKIIKSSGVSEDIQNKIQEALDFIENNVQLGKKSDIRDIKSSDLQTLLREEFAISDAVHRFWQSVKPSTESEEHELLKKLLSPEALGMEIIKGSTEVLDQNTKTIDASAFKSLLLSDFVCPLNVLYKDLDAKYKNTNKAVLPAQIRNLAVGEAHFLDNGFFNRADSALRDAIVEWWWSRDLEGQNKIISFLFGITEELAKDHKYDFWRTKEKCGRKILTMADVPQFDNIHFYTGIPGVGKTAVCSKISYEFVKEHIPNAKIAYIHVTNKAALKLKNSITDLESDNAADCYSHSEFLDKILTPEHKQEKAHEKWSIDERIGLPQTTLELNDNISGVPYNYDIIFIDEIGGYSTLELQAISKYAKKHNAFVFAMGDLEQTHKHVTINVAEDLTNFNGLEKKDGNVELRLADSMLTHYLKMGLAMRADNEQQRSAVMHTRTEKKPNGVTKLEYHYAEALLNGGKQIFGPKIVNGTIDAKNNFNYDVKAVVDEMVALSKTLETRECIGVITAAESELSLEINKRPELKGKFIRYSLDAMEHPNENEELAIGTEHPYYVMELIPSSQLDPDSYYEALYTGMSRSIRGSLIITPKNTSTVVITNILDTFPNMCHYDLKSVDASNKKFHEALDALVNQNTDGNIFYTEQTPKYIKEGSIPTPPDTAPEEKETAPSAVPGPETPGPEVPNHSEGPEPEAPGPEAPNPFEAPPMLETEAPKDDVYNRVKDTEICGTENDAISTSDAVNENEPKFYEQPSSDLNTTPIMAYSGNMHLTGFNDAMITNADMTKDVIKALERNFEIKTGSGESRRIDGFYGLWNICRNKYINKRTKKLAPSYEIVLNLDQLFMQLQRICYFYSGNELINTLNTFFNDNTLGKIRENGIVFGLTLTLASDNSEETQVYKRKSYEKGSHNASLAMNTLEEANSRPGKYLSCHITTENGQTIEIPLILFANPITFAASLGQTKFKARSVDGKIKELLKSPNDKIRNVAMFYTNTRFGFMPIVGLNGLSEYIGTINARTLSIVQTAFPIDNPGKHTGKIVFDNGETKLVYTVNGTEYESDVVVSRPYVRINENTDEAYKDIPIGHPFVLVSANPGITSANLNSIASNGPTESQRGISFSVVRLQTESASFKTYMDNLENLYTGKASVEKIGGRLTSFKIWEHILAENKIDFKNLPPALKNAVETIQKFINSAVQRVLTNELLINEVKKVFEVNGKLYSAEKFMTYILWRLYTTKVGENLVLNVNGIDDAISKYLRYPIPKVQGTPGTIVPIDMASTKHPLFATIKVNSPQFRSSVFYKIIEEFNKVAQNKDAKIELTGLSTPGRQSELLDESQKAVQKLESTPQVGSETNPVEAIKPQSNLREFNIKNGIELPIEERGSQKTVKYLVNPNYSACLVNNGYDQYSVELKNGNTYVIFYKNGEKQLECILKNENNTVYLLSEQEYSVNLASEQISNLGLDELTIYETNPDQAAIINNDEAPLLALEGIDKLTLLCGLLNYNMADDEVKVILKKALEDAGYANWHTTEFEQKLFGLLNPIYGNEAAALLTTKVQNMLDEKDVSEKLTINCLNIPLF